MRIAIDGPAGSGKSTVAHELARRLGITYLDTGAMYRSVALACLDAGVDLADERAVTDLAHGLAIGFEGGVDESRTLLDGRDVSHEIRTERIDRNVSVVAAYPGVRAAMVARQRELGSAGDVIAEGRDIGTAVFPDAEVKVFLTADAEARAHRRAVQRSGQDAATDPDAQVDPAAEAQVLADIERRDMIDSTREASPLKAAKDAVVIDTSHLSVDEVCDRIAGLVEKAREQGAQAAKGATGGQDAPEPASLAVEATQDIPDAAHIGRGKSLKAFGNEPADFHAAAMMDYPAIARGFYYVAAAAVWAWTKLWWHWEVNGAERLTRSSNGRGAVVIMNHTSMLDPCILVLSELYHRRRLRPIYKSEFDDKPFIGWFLTRIGSIPIKRGEADLKALREAQHALERGESVLIFPEGTRVKSDDEPVTIHGGFALMAQMADADIIPCGIVGARDITPRGHHLFRPGKAYVKVGEPMHVRKVRGKGRKHALADAERMAMEQAYELRDELRAQHPGRM